MDHPLNQLFVWFEERWSVISGDVISRDGGRKNDARGIMVLRSGKLIVLSQKLDLRGNQHTCGMLRVCSTRFVWGWAPGSAVKR